MIDPQEINGGALGAEDREKVDKKIAKSIGEEKKLFLDENGEIDKIWCKKYPSDSPNIGYLLDGCISVVKDEGKFLLGKFDRRVLPGAVLIDSAKSLFTSMANETKLGSTTITTLNGKVMNPVGVEQPSSGMTPNRTWIQDIIPSFRDMPRIGVIAVFTAIAAVTQFSNRKTNKVVVDARKKDVATFIIDNQEIEERILNGSL